MASIPTDDELGPDIDDADLESLRNTFVEAFNAKDLDAILGLVTDDVETPDVSGDGPAALAEELQAIWERSPGAVLTHAMIEDAPAAVAWLPEDDGVGWYRVAIFTFDGDRGRLTVVEMPDDDWALESAVAEDPTGDPVAEELDWSEWDRGEASDGGDGDWADRLVRPHQRT